MDDVRAATNRQERTRPQTGGGSDHYRREVRRHELAAERRAHPDMAVFGRCVPFGVKLPDPARGDWLLFDSDTMWINGDNVPLDSSTAAACSAR